MPPRKPKPDRTPTPKTIQAWDIRPKPPQGTANSGDVYRAVGMALTSWEYLENAIADIFVAFVSDPQEVPPRAPATRAYGSISAFNSRIDMVEAAGYAFLNPERNKATVADPKLEAHRSLMQTDFKKLLVRVRGLSARRNDIAHGIVDANKLGSFLYPASYNAKKYPLDRANLTLHERATFCYAAEDIHYYRDQFELMYDDLSRFCLNIWRDHHYTMQPRS